MNYINIKTAAEKWGITVRRVQELCKSGKINGAERFGRAWMIPENTEKPIDGRTKPVESLNESKPDDHGGFLIPAPRENPFLIHTNIYHTPGMADELVASFSDYPETAKILKAQFDCRRGDMESVYKMSEHFLDKHVGYYSTISAGVALSFCAIWRGDFNLWHKARNHIYTAPFRNDDEFQMIKFWIAVMDSNIHDVRNYPDWFSKGDFNCLPYDCFSTARVFYAKRLFVAANDLASGKINLADVESLGLMRTLPYVLEPMISQARIEKTVIPEIYLHLMAAVAYNSLGEENDTVAHIDKAIELCVPDELYGILADYRTNLGNVLDDRLVLHSGAIAEKVRRFHKKMMTGWVKLHNMLLERNVAEHLTTREREIARLAAMGLTNSEIASRLRIELSSVKQYIFSAMNKVGAQKRTELGLYV